MPAVLVTVAAPWAMAAYAIGAGLGRMLAAAIDRPRAGQATG